MISFAERKSEKQGSTPEPSVRVLLVDDDEMVLRQYSRLLKSLGFAVETAESGATGLDRLSEGTYDIIVSDVTMPRMSGLEFLRSVRARDLDVPVVLMTAMPHLDSAVEAIEYGAFRYLIKPIDRALFGGVVEKGAHLHKLATLKREALAVSGAEGMELGDRASLDARFQRALDTLWIAYQPIVNAEAQRIYGYEALVRCREPSIAHPGILFDAADRLGRMHELGRTIRRQIVADASDAPDDTLLFVNLHAGELLDPELISGAAPLTSIAERVVLEITERSALDRIPGLSTRMGELRAMGFRIAVDDLGAGYAGLSSFAQLDPEFAKLDMSLIRDLHHNPRKLSVVRAMASLCKKELGIEVICEGVEVTQERDALSSVGCALQQGYFYAKPSPGFTRPVL